MSTSGSWTRDNNSNSYLYNQGSESNTNTGWYETLFRDYDPVLGRFMQVDPLAAKYDNWSPYHYAFNDPVFWNDPSGADSRGFYWYKYALNTNGEREYSEGAIFSMYGAAWNMATYGSYTGAGGSTAAFGRSGGGRWVTFVSGVSSHQPRYNPSGVVSYEFHYGQAFIHDGAKGPDDDLGIAYTLEFAYSIKATPNLKDDYDKRVPGRTSLNFKRSDYSNSRLLFWLDVEIDPIIFDSDEFIALNGIHFHRAVFAHERGHYEQFKSIVSSPKFRVRSFTGPANLILSTSNLKGEELEELFIEVMAEAERIWQRTNRDPDHTDANQRAKRFIPSKYWEYLKPAEYPKE
jgi:RHS repeat-associated protein